MRRYLFGEPELPPEEKARKDMEAVQRQIDDTRQLIKNYTKMMEQEEQNLTASEAKITELVQASASLKRQGRTKDLAALKRRYEPLKESKTRAEERVSFHRGQIRTLERSIDNLQDTLLAKATQAQLRANTQTLPSVGVKPEEADETFDAHDEATDDVSDMRRRMAEKRPADYDAEGDLDSEFDELIQEALNDPMADAAGPAPAQPEPEVPYMPAAPTTPLGTGSGGQGGIRVVRDPQRKKELMRQLKK